MQIRVNTDDNVEGRDALIVEVEAQMRDTLSCFADRITRVEVHLSDENAAKGGIDDKRCLLEVRPTGQPPVAVTHQAGTTQERPAPGPRRRYSASCKAASDAGTTPRAAIRSAISTRSDRRVAQKFEGDMFNGAGFLS